MAFFARLVAQTQADREAFLQREIFQQTLAGELSLKRYLAFLEQAYHHVRHTVPLMMACGSRLNVQHAWLQPALAEYIEEEQGHEQWILNDIRAAGGNAERAAQGVGSPQTETMVAYAYYQIERVNPLAFFGMVYVLEGTSTALASDVASIIRQRLKLPDEAFSYLRSHGALDIEHMGFFEGLMDQVTEPDDQDAIIHTARNIFRLYGEMLSALPE